MALTSSSPGDVSQAGQNGAGTAAHPRLLTLALGSLGVVFGDIGTSPLYAFRIATTTALGEDGAPDRAAIFGVLSLILWAIILIVSAKYVMILMRADNNGEGGTLSLMA